MRGGPWRGEKGRDRVGKTDQLGKREGERWGRGGSVYVGMLISFSGALGEYWVEVVLGMFWRWGGGECFLDSWMRAGGAEGSG